MILLVHFLKLCEVSYKPILEEVEKILREAGLEEEEMRKGATLELGGGPGMSSRNRR